jgi:hypothetical protein
MKSIPFRWVALLLVLAPFSSYACGETVPSEHANEARIDHLLPDPEQRGRSIHFRGKPGIGKPFEATFRDNHGITGATGVRKK